VGIIACVEPTTTTAAATTSVTKGTVILGDGVSTVTPKSGTTVVPTSSQTTTACQKDMAVVGGIYVASVDYSVAPVRGTNSNDLTSTTGNGITFPKVNGFTGVVDSNGNAMYVITITFVEPGVDSLGSIIVNKNINSNVDQIAVQFFVSSNPNQPISVDPEAPYKPLTIYSTIGDQGASITNLPAQLPSPISGVRVLVISTSDKQ
jgi:hypothetical protein